jgi:putative oxidoreductase
MTIQSATNAAPGLLARTGVWGLKGLLALAFLAAAYLKLSGNPHMVAEFGKIGFGQGFRYLTGAVEVVGAALLLWPRSAFLGAIVLLGICGGAFIAQVGPLHGDMVHVFMLGGLLALTAWISRPTAVRRGGL